jgi:hypothetical protein
MNTNDYGTEVSVGRYDALNGLFLKGDGKGGFAAAPILESGLYIPGNGKALVKARDAAKNTILIASQNRGPLKVFKLRNSMRSIPVEKTDVSAVVRYKDGRVQKQELYYGTSFLSQSGRFLQINDSIASIEIVNSSGAKRSLPIH